MTNVVKVVSFDLWFTLVKPLGRGEARAKILARAFGIEATEEFRALCGNVNKEFDRRSEDTGLNFSCGDRIDRLVEILGLPKLKPARRALLVRTCQSSTRKNQPVLIDPEILTKLSALRAKGLKLALISNTGYPEGEVMREVVANLGLAALFDTMVFSSEVGVAKPSPAMYQYIANSLNVEPHEILHVGDSRKADYDGARAFGARALHFSPEEESVEHERIKTLDEIDKYLDDEVAFGRHALYELSHSADGVIQTNGSGFCEKEYSRFKHGDARVQRKYGYLVADFFIDILRQRLIKDSSMVVVAPFMYKHVPTAAANMLDWFHDRLGTYLRFIRRPAVERFQVYRYAVNHGQDHQYAKNTGAERTAILNSISYSLDKNRLVGKTVVFIDDIYITGASEANTRKMLEGCGAREVIFLYIARMDPSTAAKDAAVESRLNQASIKTLRDLQEIMTPGAYRMNLRNCKFILDAEVAEVEEFAASLDSSVLRDIYATCLANAYYLTPAYAVTFECIEAEMGRRGDLTPPIPVLPVDWLIRTDPYEETA